MKKIILTSAILLCSIMGFSQQMPAQNPPTAEQIAQREANALSQRLSLTEDQRSKAYAIYLEKAKKDLAAREARLKEMQKQRELATAEAKQQSDKITQLLNADQKKTFQDMQSRMGNRMERPGGSSRMGRAPQQGGPGFQRGPGRQLQRPGGPGQRMQPGQGGQPQRPNMPPNFQGRPGGRGSFQPGRPGVQNIRPQIRQRLQGPGFQNRLDRYQQRFGAPQAAPDNTPPKPSESK